MSDTQKDVGNNLNHLFWTESMNTKTFGGWLTVWNHRNYLQMHYLQGGMGYLKSALPKMGKNREKDTKVGWPSAEIYTGAVWTAASRSEHSHESKYWHFITSHRWHHSYGWLKVDTRPPAVSRIRQEDIRNDRQWSTTTMTSLQPFNHSGQVLVACFSLFSLLGQIIKLRKPLHRSSVPSSIWRVPYQQSCTPPL